MDEYFDLVSAPPLWAGGATTFAELDAWNEAQRVALAIDATLAQFNALMANVARGDAPANYEKAQALVEELADRIEAVQGNPDIALKAAGDPVYPEVVPQGDTKAGAVTKPDGTFMAYKDDAGVARWVTIHTNKFIDRDREIFSEKSHRDYVARVDASGKYPDLQLWHTPVPIGRADMIDYDDRGFVIASGTYLPGYEDVGERLAEMAAKGEALGCSHGFQYDRLDRLDGVFEWYDTREITVLPLQRAANLLTTSAPRGSKEIEMLNTEKAAFLERALGPERFAAEIEGKLNELAQKAADEGLDFKEAAVAEAPPAEAAAEAPPSEATPAEGTAAPAVTVTTTDPAATVTIDNLTVGVPEGAAPGDLASQVINAIEAQGGLEAPAEEPPAEPTEAKDETIPEHPLETPAPAAEAPLDATSPEAQMLDLMRKAMTEVIAPVMDRMAAIEQKQAELATDNDGIKAAMGRGMDQAIADAFRPKVGPPATAPASMAGEAPSPAQIAAIEGLKADAEKGDDDDTPEHLRPFMRAMVKPLVEN